MSVLLILARRTAEWLCRLHGVTCVVMCFCAAGSNPGNSTLFNVPSAAPAQARKTGADDFLNSENDKNDYDWYILFTFLTFFF